MLGYNDLIEIDSVHERISDFISRVCNYTKDNRISEFVFLYKKVNA